MRSSSRARQSFTVRSTSTIAPCISKRLSITETAGADSPAATSPTIASGSKRSELLEDLPVTRVAKLPRSDSFGDSLDHHPRGQHYENQVALGRRPRVAPPGDGRGDRWLLFEDAGEQLEPGPARCPVERSPPSGASASVVST